MTEHDELITSLLVTFQQGLQAGTTQSGSCPHPRKSPQARMWYEGRKYGSQLAQLRHEVEQAQQQESKAEGRYMKTERRKAADVKVRRLTEADWAELRAKLQRLHKQYGPRKRRLNRLSARERSLIAR